MTSLELPVPFTHDLTKQQFLEFYSQIFNTQSYLGTLVFQCTHLHMLLFHVVPHEMDASKISLGELLDLAQMHDVLNAKQLKVCRTLLELQLYYSSKSLLKLSMETGKGVYFFGKVNEILFDLTQRLHMDSEHTDSER